MEALYIYQICRDLWFSRQCCWRHASSGTWHCAAQQVVPNIVNVLEYIKTEGTTSPTTKWQIPENLCLHAQSCGNRTVVISASLVTLCLSCTASYMSWRLLTTFNCITFLLLHHKNTANSRNVRRIFRWNIPIVFRSTDVFIPCSVMHNTVILLM
jgi:hypothetical protein